MSASPFERSFSARLHAELDPDLPDINAERRVLDAVARHPGRRGYASRTGGGLRPGIGNVVVAALVVLVVGGALTVSLVLGRQSAGLAPAGSSGPAPVARSPDATLGACDGEVLAARVLDRGSGAGYSSGDVALTNTGAVACTIEGSVSVSALVDGHVRQVAVAHIAGGSEMPGGHSPVAPAQRVTLVPGYEAFFAFEVAGPAGQTACMDPGALLITPPHGHRYAVVNSWPVSLCAHDGAALWIGVAPVSSTPYFASRS